MNPLLGLVLITIACAGAYGSFGHVFQLFSIIALGLTCLFVGFREEKSAKENN
jgi:hypothetical protein